MSSVPAVHDRLLDLILVVSGGANLVMAVGWLVVDDPSVAARGTTVLALAAALVGLWWCRRRTADPAVSLVLSVVAVVLAVVGDNIVALLPVFFAVLLLVLDLGPRAGAAFIAILLALLTVSFLVVVRLGVLATVGEVSVTASLFAYVYALALVLRRSAVDAAERAVLLRQRDQANHDLARANARLRRSIDIEKELVLADERARSARELHDGLGHRLTLIKLGLDLAERTRDASPFRAWDEVARARRCTQDAIADMRLWVRALSPVSVTGLSGAAALDAVAESFRGTGLEVRLDVEGLERELPQRVNLFCHRLVQEGLTNALRHARPDTVRVGLHYLTGGVELTLADDGGPVPGISYGFGLRSLAERASELGGSFQVVPTLDGVALAAWVPTAEQDARLREGGT